MSKTLTPAIFHGGNLSAASEQYGIPAEQWLDLSTGISPFAYPIPPIPEKYFRDLPYSSEPLISAACEYYLPIHNDTRQSPNAQLEPLITAGSQFTIQNLPQVLAHLPVLLPSIGYQEHHAAWHANGNACHHYDALTMEKAIEDIGLFLQLDARQHLVIIHPNNPSGLTFSLEQLLSFKQLQDPKAMLIVDEAFIDLDPQQSLLSRPLPDNSIVLRSFGKFFGLAGLRIGTVFGDQQVIQALSSLQGPWAVSGVSQFIAAQAWQSTPSNQAWLDKQQEQVRLAYTRTLKVMSTLFGEGTQNLTPNISLFVSYLCPEKEGREIYEFFASKGILLRYVPVNEEQAIIRTSLLNHLHPETINRVEQTILSFKRKA